MVLYSKKDDCCGCSACKSICSKAAIQMVPDEEGFLYPVIDENKCINCGKCNDVCAFKNGYSTAENLKEPLVYAVRQKTNKKIVLKTITVLVPFLFVVFYFILLKIELPVFECKNILLIASTFFAYVIFFNILFILLKFFVEQLMVLTMKKTYKFECMVRGLVPLGIFMD